MRTDRQTHRGMDGRTDMAKLIVTFRNFASTPKTGYLTACHAWTQFTFMRRVETLCGCPSTSILLTETWQTRCCFVARRSFVGVEKNYTGAYKLLEEFAKPYFHKYWNEIHGVITIWKRNVCSLIVTLNAFDVRPTCDTADVQAILQFPPNPLKHVLCDVPNCGVDVLSAILAVSLEVAGRKHCPWRNPTGRNHTLSGLVTGVARCSHFPPTLLYAFFREMAAATIGPFHMLGSLCVIDTNFTILRHFLLKLWSNEILR